MIHMNDADMDHRDRLRENLAVLGVEVWYIDVVGGASAGISSHDCLKFAVSDREREKVALEF